MPATKESSTYHHGALKEALVLAALELVDEGGVDAVTVRAVARRAGVSHSAPANHFATLRALLTAVATQLFRELRTEITPAQLACRTQGADRIREFAKALVHAALSQPNRYRLLWRRDVVDDNDGDLQAEMDGLYDDIVAVTQALYTTPCAFDADTFVVALWSAIHGYVSLRLDGNFVDRQDSVSGKQRFDAIVELLLASLDT